MILHLYSEVWQLPSLKPELKQVIIYVSTNTLKTSHHQPDPMEYFLNIQKSCNIVLSSQFTKYKHAEVLLHKLNNVGSPSIDLLNHNFMQTLTSRQTNKKVKQSRFKVRNNLLYIRLAIINDKILLIGFNLSLESLKNK